MERAEEYDADDPLTPSVQTMSLAQRQKMGEVHFADSKTRRIVFTQKVTEEPGIFKINLLKPNG
jgi:hypothetical protein